jgi:imidazolonepropionase-like amidohydrolase
MNSRYRWIAISLLFLPGWLFAQDEKDLAPVTRTYAITNATVIQAPGRKIEMGTVIVKDGLITAVGKGIAIPPEAIVIKADSMFIYAGFIDGLSRAGVIKPKEETNRERVKDPGNPPNDRAGIMPQIDVRNSLASTGNGLEDLRNLGFTTTQVVPYGNLLPGSAAIILTGSTSPDAMVLNNKSALYSELSGANNLYPSNILGVMAKWRELYRQASQAKSYEAMYASNRSGLERPTSDRTLEAFYPVIDQKIPVLFKAERLLDANRVLILKNDLNFPLVLAELKDGWPMINKLKASGAKIFLSLDLPEEVKSADKEKDKDKKDASKNPPANPKPKTAAELEKEALDKRKAEAIANYAAQASAFQKAGVTFGFSSMSAKSKDITANLRRMIKAGLSEDAALAALTVNPAQLLGLSDRMGSVDNGKMANLVITDKSYFDEKAKVRYVFVDGVMYKMEAKETKKSDPNAKVELEGTWSTVTQTPQGNNEGKLIFKKEGSGYTGTASGGRMAAPVDLKDVTLDGTSLSFNYTVTFGGNTVRVEVTATVDGDTFKGTSNVGTFGSFVVEGTKNPKN